MSSQVYLELPKGYIVPVTQTGRTSGNWIHVIMPMGIGQWVHIDHILFDDEVEMV
jgi:hypothetical protein